MYVNELTKTQTDIARYSSSELKIIPNPATKSMQLTNALRKSVSIVSGTGVKLVNIENYAGGDIDISWLENGIYTVVVRNDAETQTIQLIKEK